ncbi:MAG: DNA translocase FtsK [Patescibacteria group bacterium]|nr:DNA translocase FtsK [Patescibacteria group bacterium]MCL5431789.1 DNA translocase FtsK [Patescibacteria group bacterium]
MRYRKRSLFRLKLRKQTVYSIFSLGLLATAGLIMVSTFYPQGAILTKLSALFDLYFGWGKVFFAITLVQLALLLSRVKIGPAKPNSVIGYFLILCALLGLSQSGNLGQTLFATIYTLIPLGFVVFFVLLLVAILGATVLFNLSIGEVIEIFTDSFKAIKDFFNKLFSFTKKPSPVFVKDSQVKPATAPAMPSQNLEPKVPSPQQPRLPIPEGTLTDDKIIQNTPPEQDSKVWEYPPLSLLSDASGGTADRGDIKQNAAVIEKTLESFGITARVAEVNKGPAVTQYALEIALGTKLSKITTLQNDLALALAAPGQIRIEAPIPGRALVGIEIPNRTPEFVTVRSILESDRIQQAKSKLAVSLGLDVSGNPQVVDIAKMPHVLIAGSTGSGKSVCINAFLTSLLYRNSPSELKLILVDPKRVELSLYNGIPHLLTPVIVEVDKVLSSLKWAIAEMERRYKLFASAGVRNIEGYNEMAGFQALPYLVIVVDEMADVMMFAPVEVEDAICRLAQMARATGIHLVLSTQRPSVDVITGLIKANIPCRIAFNVTSMIDSRVIIDTPGAEKLLGKGDMLYIPPDQSKPSRIQGAFVSDGEVHKLVDWLKARGGPVQYTQEVTTMQTIIKSGPGGKQTSAGGGDPLVDEAIRIVCQYDRASASLLQRKLSIGYARAARILDTLEELGIVGPGEGSKPRDVLVRNADEYFANQNQSQTPEQQ